MTGTTTDTDMRDEPAKGPGGHTPDGTGPYGRGQGPGSGQANGSGKNPIGKSKRYIKDPSQAPKGAKVLQGKKGGYYYETGQGGNGDKNDIDTHGRELFRAADKSDIKEGACFAEQLEDAEAYTENVGFGGKNLWRTEIEPEQPLYLTRDGENLYDLLGLDRVDYSNEFEVIDQSKYREQLRDMGYDWVVYEEPTAGAESQITTTWVYLGGREPKLTPLTPIKGPEKEKTLDNMDEKEINSMIQGLEEEIEDEGLDPDDYYSKDDKEYIKNLKDALNKSFNSCRFTTRGDKAERIREFLRRHGDELPEEAIEQAVEGENLNNWATVCDETGEIISGVTYMHNDWYLCTLHNLATDPEFRGQGLGSKVVDELLQKIDENPDCHVLAGDITFDNTPSKRIFERRGFKPVSRFCWEKGKKPADIVHYIRFRPTDDNRCL